MSNALLGVVFLVVAAAAAVFFVRAEGVAHWIQRTSADPGAVVPRKWVLVLRAVYTLAFLLALAAAVAFFKR
jgi:hypothetical protein